MCSEMVTSREDFAQVEAREDAASPIVSSESLFITGMIDAKEKRDVMTTDVHNAFIQTGLEYRPNEYRRIVV